MPVGLGGKLKKIRQSFNVVIFDEVNREDELLVFSQSDMVEKLGFTDDDGIYRSSISGYEPGTRMPPYYVLLAYAKAANVYLEVLVDDLLDFPPGKMPYKVKSDGIRRLFG